MAYYGICCLWPMGFFFFTPSTSINFLNSTFHNTETLFMKTTAGSCLKASMSYLRERRQPL